MRILLSAVFSTGFAMSALALDVDFSGTLSTTCTLALSSSGTLALSADGQTLGSEEGAGISALVTVLSIGANTVTVDAPIRMAAPGTYDGTLESLEVSYSGAGGLSLISQAYTPAQTTFGVNNIPLSLLTVDNRIVNSNGFVAGTYTTRTVITCS